MMESSFFFVEVTPAYVITVVNATGNGTKRNVSY